MRGKKPSSAGRGRGTKTGSAPAYTLESLLRTAAARLTRARLSYGHGTLEARDEAAWLVLHALGLPLDTPASSRRIAAPAAQRALALVDERIARRVPAAYLTHEAWLGGLPFYVDERVIVPRSFIADLLPERFAPWLRHPARVKRVLDLCTGSGCLAILLAKTFPKAQVDAVDVSPEALAVAERNVRAYRLGRHIELIRSNMFAALGDRRYDLIISNPPYVTAAAMKALPAEYRSEPDIALAGGKDGFDFVRTILKEAPRHLNDDGLLLVEPGHARARLEKAFPRLPFIWPDTSGGDDCVFLLEQPVAILR